MGPMEWETSWDESWAKNSDFSEPQDSVFVHIRRSNPETYSNKLLLKTLWNSPQANQLQRNPLY